MYTPEQRTAYEIIHDNSIILPRFQRKKSWGDSDRFKLCVSLFKEYPMGTIVLKKETRKDKKKNNKTIKWLLDGRQRRDTLVDMQNPENIYRWAKTFLGFKKNDDDVKIEKCFHDKLSEYLYYEEAADLQDEQDDQEEENIEEGESLIVTTDDEDESEDDESLDEEPLAENEHSEEDQIDGELESVDRKDLDDLLFIIQSVHKLNTNSSRFTKPFYFKVENFRPSYMSKDDKGKSVVDSKKLTEWILARKFDEYEELTPEIISGSFDNCPSAVEKAIRNRMDDIKRSIDCVLKIHDKIVETRVSIIFLDDNCSPSDSQKIFEIINTQGVSLTNAEILSAKPIWNGVVSEPRETIIENVNSLYDGIGTERQNNVVKWDVAATLTCRLPAHSDYIFGDLRNISFKSNSKEDAVKVDNKINYGFKLFAGRYSGSISKNVVDNLANENIDWNSSDFEDEIAAVCECLMKNDPGIRRYNSYHYPLRKLLGDTVVMCYIILLINKYNELTNNRSSELKGSNRKTFIVYSRILLDRLIYEHSCSFWKGSSDSRLKSYLKNPSVAFTQVEKNVWDALITEVYESNEINGNPAKKNVLTVLIYYFSMIRNKSLDLEDGESPQIDHIIPDGTFTKESSDIKFKDSLINFALLPPLLNNKKKANINSIEQVYLEEICKLEDIDVETIKQLNDPGSMSILKTKRMAIIDDIKEKRDSFVKGENSWGINV